MTTNYIPPIVTVLIRADGQDIGSITLNKREATSLMNGGTMLVELGGFDKEYPILRSNTKITGEAFPPEPSKRAPPQPVNVDLPPELAINPKAAAHALLKERKNAQ